MTHDEMLDLTLQLRRNVRNELINVFKLLPSKDKEIMFFIVSASLGSIIADATWNLFKKDVHISKLNEYIDDLAEAAKIQLKEFLDKKDELND